MNFNQAILCGRLVADPEVRYTQSGVAVASFRLAVDRAYKDSSGEKQTDFINCVAWRKTAETIQAYVKKGHELLVIGELQMRKFQTKEGENRTVYEVVVSTFRFGSKPSGGSGGNYGGRSDEDAPQAYGGSYADTPSGGVGVEPEDDLPF